MRHLVTTRAGTPVQRDAKWCARHAAARAAAAAASRAAAVTGDAPHASDDAPPASGSALPYAAAGHAEGDSPQAPGDSPHGIGQRRPSSVAAPRSDAAPRAEPPARTPTARGPRKTVKSRTHAGPNGRRPRRGDQLEMRVVCESTGANPSWGGARRGAGAKRRGTRRVPHRARPLHKDTNPVHVTLRARAGLPSFRQQRVHAMLVRILHRQKKRAYAGEFQVVEYSIQKNHVHVILEAEDKTSLRSGASGLAIAFAKQLNKLLLRAKGKVWAERYHAHELGTPREVRNALSYVFQNYKKHGAVTFGHVVDRHSSAALFDGWAFPVLTFPDVEPWRTPPLRTWMLRTGWKRHGLLLPSDRPASRR